MSIRSIPARPGNANAGTYGYDTDYGDPGGLYSSADLCNILRAVADSRFNQSNQLNSRQVVYFEPTIAKSSTAPRGGLVTATNGVTGALGNTIPYGAYVDPWGMEYVVFINASYSGSLNTPPYGGSAISWYYYPNTPSVTAPVAATSLGLDNNWGAGGNKVFSGSDDVATWQ